MRFVSTILLAFVTFTSGLIYSKPIAEALISASAVPFGETAILDDGRLVVTPWPGRGTGVFIGPTHLDGPVLRLPDACTAGDGHVWVSAHAQDTTDVYALRDDGLTVNVGFGFGTRTIIRCDGTSAAVGFTDSGTTWRVVAVSATGVQTVEQVGSIDDGSGGNGMREFDATGKALPNQPLDAPFYGWPAARLALHQGTTAIAEALGGPDAILVSVNGGSPGNLYPGGADTLRLSKHGGYWTGVRYVGEVTASGAVPTAVIPWQPVPEIPRTPRRYRFGQFFLKRGDDADPTAPGDFEVSANRWGSTHTRDVIAATLDDAAEAGANLIATYSDSASARWDNSDIAPKVKQFHVPIVLNWDGDCTSASWPSRIVDPQDSATVTMIDISRVTLKSVEAYPRARTETPAHTIARVDACVRQILATDAAVMVVRPSYLQQGDPNWDLAQIVALQPLYQQALDRWLTDFPTKAITSVNFAWKRAQYGADQNPTIKAWLTAEAGAMPLGAPMPLLGTSVAPAPPSGGLVKPEVTVVKWDLATLKDGAEAVVEDRQNPALGYRMRVWVENGSMYFQITNAAGEGHTGARRAVIR